MTQITLLRLSDADPDKSWSVTMRASWSDKMVLLMAQSISKCSDPNWAQAGYTYHMHCMKVCFLMGARGTLGTLTTEVRTEPGWAVPRTIPT